MHIIPPGKLDGSVHQAEVELAFFGFGQVPANRRERGIKMISGKFGQYGRHVIEAGGSGIVQFAAEDQERLAVNDQLGGRALFGEMRNAGGLSGLSAG